MELSEKIVAYYGIVDEGEIVKESELLDWEEVTICQVPMELSWKIERS